MTSIRPRRRWFHAHQWHVTPAFTTPSGWPWPPMWACPCGYVKAILSPQDWGLGV